MHEALVGGLGEVRGDSWLQLAELGLAFVLSSLIGLERAMRGRDAGLHTYALVGVGAALFLLVGKYGFENALTSGLVVLDPSRVAAQVVTGVGFLGSALIIKRGETVRGLTTAATVWVTAAIGMACAAGLPVLAVAVTVAHFIVVFGYTRLHGKLGLPGGAAEADESPNAACRREVAEELGLDRPPGRVLAVDWVPARTRCSSRTG